MKCLRPTVFLGTPLILRFSLCAPSGWTVRMLHLEAQADVLEDPGGEDLVAELAQLPAESALTRRRRRSAMACSGSCSSKICTITESVSVKSSQHLREEPSHVSTKARNPPSR